MGIISTLLTGGSILGKICQTIKDSGIKTVEDGNGGLMTVRSSYSEINGVRFSEVCTEGQRRLTAYNTDVDLYACVSYPNGVGKSSGFQMFIPPVSTEEMILEDWGNASPDLPFYVQKIDLRDGAAMENNRVIVAFRNLGLDRKTLEMPNTHITASLYDITVFFATARLGDLASAEFWSGNGVHATLREPVQVIQEEAPGTTRYKIPLDQLGYVEEDVLSGIMQFKISQDSAKAIREAAQKRVSSNGLGAVTGLMRSIDKG